MLQVSLVELLVRDYSENGCLRNLAYYFSKDARFLLLSSSFNFVREVITKLIWFASGDF